MLYRIIPYEQDTGRVYISPKLFMKHYERKDYKTVIHAGLRKMKVSVVTLAELKDNEVKVTTDVLEALSIPLNISYQIQIKETGICIGPVIGMLLAHSSQYFTEDRLEKFLEYALRYEEIQGLLYVFSTEGINFDQNSAEGFYFNPKADGLRPKWERGIFPLPDSIFRRVGLSNGMLYKLKQATKSRMFNSYYFDKWEFWNMASKNGLIKNNIPFTSMFKSFQHMDKMFASYDSLYLKPVNGTLGNGLVKVVKTIDGYSIQRKADHNPIIITSKEQAVDFINGITSGHRYLVQQDIHLLKYQDQYVDFRVNMQKDYSMRWNCTSIIACTGAKGGIHSNYMNEGGYFIFEDFMTKVLSVSMQDTFKKRYDIVELCKKVCNMLDESGENYGDLGIDIGFDQSLKPWIFEVNKCQFYNLSLMVNDYQAYYAAKTNPVSYATALSGFKMLQMD